MIVSVLFVFVIFLMYFVKKKMKIDFFFLVVNLDINNRCLEDSSWVFDIFVVDYGVVYN